MSEEEVEQIAFVICPIDEPDSPMRRRSDEILDQIIVPVVAEFGYEAIRADNISEPGPITDQVFRRLLEAPLVIAARSHYYPNVYYELGIRHVIGKPVIQIIEEGQRIPFDVSGLRTIEVVTERLDHRSMEDSKEELRRQIRFIEENPDRVEASVRSVIFQNLTEGRPVERWLENLLQGLDSAVQGIGLPSLRRRGFGNILINTETAPGHTVTIRPSETLDLYFGQVTWSGGQADLYISEDGYSSLTIPGDMHMEISFSIADLRSPSIDSTTYPGFSVGQNWIRGPIPDDLMADLGPDTRYYVKAYDGSMSAVAVTDSCFRIS